MATGEVPVNMILPLPNVIDQILVCQKSCDLYIMNLGGEVVRKMSTEGGKGEALVHCALSPQGKFAYAVSESGKLYTFDLSTGELLNELRVCA